VQEAIGKKQVRGERASQVMAVKRQMQDARK